MLGGVGEVYSVFTRENCGAGRGPILLLEVKVDNFVCVFLCLSTYVETLLQLSAQQARKWDATCRDCKY